MAKQETLVLAFDIERSGGLGIHDTIAVGAAVVDEQLNVLDSLLLKAYFGREKTAWEPRCWDEFWSKHESTLETLRYDGPLSKDERAAEVVAGFQAFRRKWEARAEKEGETLELVSDNKVYDGGFVNDMIFKFGDGQNMPLPYRATGGLSAKYGKFWETHSEQRGLLMAVDPEFKPGKDEKTDRWIGYTERIEQLYGIPPWDVKHDHSPENDAATIAREQQILLGIKKRKYRLVGENGSAPKKAKKGDE